MYAHRNGYSLIQRRTFMNNAVYCVFNPHAELFGNVNSFFGRTVIKYAYHFFAAHSESTVRTCSCAVSEYIGNAFKDNVSCIMSVCIVYTLEFINVAHDNIHCLIFVQRIYHCLFQIFVQTVTVFKLGKLVRNSCTMIHFLLYSKVNSAYYLRTLFQRRQICFFKSLFFYSRYYANNRIIA